MSLSIHVRYEDENGEKKYVDFELGHQLGGFEVSRYEFWGHPIMESLGIKILVTLRDGAYLQIKDDALDEFENEVNIIRENCEMLMEKTNQSEDFIMFHTDNLLRAIGKAREVNGTLTMG